MFCFPSGRRKKRYSDDVEVKVQELFNPPKSVGTSVEFKEEEAGVKVEKTKEKKTSWWQWLFGFKKKVASPVEVNEESTALDSESQPNGDDTEVDGGSSAAWHTVSTDSAEDSDLLVSCTDSVVESSLVSCTDSVVESSLVSGTDSVVESSLVSGTDSVVESSLVSGTDSVVESSLVSGTDSVVESSLVSGTDSVVESSLVSGTDSVVERSLVSGTDSVVESSLVSGTDSAEDSDLVSNTDSAEDSDLVSGTDSVVDSGLVPGTDSAEDSDLVSNTDSAEDSDLVPGTDSVVDSGLVPGTDSAEDSDLVSNTDSAEDSDLVSSTDSAEDSGLASGTDSVVDSGLVSNTDSAEDSDLVSGTDSAEDSDLVSGTDSAEDSGLVSGTDSAEDSDLVSGTDSAEDSDLVSGTDSAEDSDLVSGTDSAEDSDLVSHIDSVVDSDLVSRIDSVVDSDLVSRIDSVVDSDLVSRIDSVVDSGLVSRIDSVVDSSLVSRIDSVVDSGLVSRIDSVVDSGLVSRIDSVVDSGLVSRIDSVVDSGLVSGTDSAEDSDLVSGTDSAEDSDLVSGTDSVVDSDTDCDVAIEKDATSRKPLPAGRGGSRQLNFSNTSLSTTIQSYYPSRRLPIGPKPPPKGELVCLGLPNLAQTCYMNSTLQSLLTLSHFIQDVYMQHEVWGHHPKSQILRGFVNVGVCRLLNNPMEKIDALTSFKNIVANFNDEFDDNQQKDAHEFLSCVLNVLRSSSSDMRPAVGDGGVKYSCPIDTHVVFNIVSTRTCKGCGFKSLTTQEHLYLSLDLVPGGSVGRCLKDYMKESQLEYNCSCGATESTEQVAFSTLPNVLIIQLKRFAFCQADDVKKLNFPINLTKELMVVQRTVAKNARTLYTLTSVINHLGSTANSGHYICDGAQPNQVPGDARDLWLTYNDEHVTPTTGAAVCQRRQETAYLLFYEKQMWKTQSDAANASSFTWNTLIAGLGNPGFIEMLTALL